MTQVRHTIELLSKVLSENGTTQVRAELFRQAKFDQADAIQPLWKLLFELIYYCDYSKIDDVAVKAFAEFSQEELVVYVKRGLQQHGYYSRDFAALPTDMSSSSRELLLAFGWLLCKEDLIQRFMRNCTSPLDDDTSAMHQDSQPKSSNRPASARQKPADPFSKVQQLLVLNNKLRLSLRSLYALQSEKNVLKHKIHEATLGAASSPDRKHLSQLEVYMLRHPDLLKNNLQLLEVDNQRLQNLLRWQDHSEVFCQWMGSVLDAKEQGRSGRDDDSADNVTASSTSSVLPMGERRQRRGEIRQPDVAVLSRLQQTHLSLQDAIIKYEMIVDHLEDSWEEKRIGVTDAELDEVLSSLDLELSVQRANIALRNCKSYLQQQQSLQDLELPLPTPSVSDLKSRGDAETQFSLHRKPQSKPANNRLGFGEGGASVAKPEQICDIEDEIQGLNQMVDRMQREVDDKQNSFKRELQSLNSKLKDAVCIPPMERKF